MPSLCPVKSDDESSLSEADTADIEDLLEPPSKRQKRNASPLNPRALKQSSSPRIPGKVIVKDEPDQKPTPTPKQRRLPARTTRDVDGSVKVEPPSNWETMYEIVKKMRAANPTAPVDTMGCAELYWRASSPIDRRFQTLIALMLSSQTKDTVTAVAMQRLHTELGDGTALAEDIKIKQEDEDSKPVDSTLNLTNILAVDPTRLNELIRTVAVSYTHLTLPTICSV